MSNAHGSRPNNSDETAVWEEFASFMVYLEHRVENGVEELRTMIERQASSHRTDVHHMETGEHFVWPGIAIHDACRWMLSRLADQDGPESKHPGESIRVPSRAYEIQRVCVVQPPQTGRPQLLFETSQAFSGFVEGSKPFAIDVTFGPASSHPDSGESDSVGWEVAIYAQDPTTWEVTDLDTIKGRGRDSHQSRVVRATISNPLLPGLYRLRVVLRWSNERNESSREIPMLQAV